MDVMDFFDILIHPQERMPKEMKKANVNDAVKTFAILGAVIGFFFGLMIAFAGGVLGVLTGNPLGGLGMLAIVVMPIVGAIVVVLGSAISAGVPWLVANFLGGKGTFDQNYYLNARLVAPMIVGGVIIGILNTIPLLGWIIQLAWTVYSVYLSIVLISVANKLPMGKAFLAWAIPILVVLVLMAMVFGFLIAAAIAAFAGVMR